MASIATPHCGYGDYNLSVSQGGAMSLFLKQKELTVGAEGFQEENWIPLERNGSCTNINNNVY